MGGHVPPPVAAAPACVRPPAAPLTPGSARRPRSHSRLLRANGTQHTVTPPLGPWRQSRPWGHRPWPGLQGGSFARCPLPPPPLSLSSLLLHILGGPGPKRPAVERPGGSGQAALLAEEKKTRLQKTHFLELLLNTATACSFRKHFARAPHPVTEPRVRPASRAATIPAADRQLPAGGRRVPTAAPGLLGGAGQAGPAPRVLTQRL